MPLILSHTGLARLTLAALAIIFLGPAPPATAAPLVVAADHTGWYDNTGLHDSSNTNYIAGGPGSYGQFYHDFFEFTVPSLKPTYYVLNADLLVTQGVTVSEYPYLTTLPYDLYDVSTPAPTLIASQTGQTAIYQDLGSGTSYGTFAVSTDDHNGQVLDFTLNPAAVQAINANLGDTFAIGGAIDFSQIARLPYGAGYTFAATQGPGSGQGVGADLSLTVVPEASSVVSLGLLLALGLGAVSVQLWKKSKADKSAS